MHVAIRCDPGKLLGPFFFKLSTHHFDLAFQVFGLVFNRAWWIQGKSFMGKIYNTRCPCFLSTGTVSQSSLLLPLPYFPCSRRDGMFFASCRGGSHVIYQENASMLFKLIHLSLLAFIEKGNPQIVFSIVRSVSSSSIFNEN